jgi:hypothetical protein
MGKNILNWSLPSVLTCPGAGECLHFCYSKKASIQYPNARNSRLRNYHFTKDESFVSTLSEYLNKRSEPIVRVHTDGDFYSQEYLNKWIEIAKASPNKRFYGYTKSFKLDFSALPSNMKVIQSYGSTYDDLIDSSKNTARVINDISELGINEYLCPYVFKEKDEDFKCSESCSYCIDNAIVHVAFIKH